MPKRFPIPPDTTDNPNDNESGAENVHPDSCVSIEMIPNEPSDDFLLQLLADGAECHIVAETLRRRDEPNATMVAELLLLIADAVPKFHQAIASGQNAFYEYLQAQERQRMLAVRSDFSTEDRSERARMLEQEGEVMRDATDRQNRHAYASCGIGDCLTYCPAIVNDPRFREPIDADTAEISALREQLANWPANHKWEFTLLDGWPKSMLRRGNVRTVVKLVTVAPKGLRTR